MASGCRGTPYFRRYDRELVLKPTGDFVKEKLGEGGGYRTTTPSPYGTVRSLAWSLGPFFSQCTSDPAISVPIIFAFCSFLFVFFSSFILRSELRNGMVSQLHTTAVYTVVGFLVWLSY